MERHVIAIRFLALLAIYFFVNLCVDFILEEEASWTHNQTVKAKNEATIETTGEIESKQTKSTENNELEGEAEDAMEDDDYDYGDEEEEDDDEVEEGERVPYVLPSSPLYTIPSSIAYCNKTPEEVVDEGKLVLLGGIGGSGTRAVQIFCSQFGWLGGSLVQPVTADSRDCFVRNTVSIMRVAKNINQAFFTYRKVREEEIMNRLYSPTCIGEKGFYAEGNGSCFFGFKNPPVVYQMGYFRYRFPDMKLVHIVRDGRDMAFSRNTRQLREFKDKTLFKRELSLPLFHKQALFWSRANIAIRNAALRLLGSANYLIVRIEDLVQNEELKLKTMSRIATFLLGEQVPYDLLRNYTGIFQATTYGKWRSLPKEDIITVEQAAKEGLETFGYRLEYSK